MSDQVLFEKQGKVALIKLNKAPVNSYNHDFFMAFGKAIDQVRFDDSINVAIVTSALDGIFSAGADIRMLKESTPDFKAMFCLNCQETLTKMESTPKIFIGALNGTTVGGGLEIALATDLRFVADGEKVKLGLPEVTLGVLPGTGGTQRLPRLVGKSRALDLMITGRLLTPQEALQIGLVDRVFPASQFMQKTMEYAENLANGPARAVALIKRAVQQGTEMSLDAGLALERELQNRLFVTQDAKEGLRHSLRSENHSFLGSKLKMVRPRTERLVRGLKAVRDQLVESVSGCPGEEFDWKPRPGMKSIKDMLRECGGIEKVLLEYARTGEQLDFQKIVKWSGEDLASTLADLATIRNETIAFIGQLVDGDLDVTRKNRRGEDTEVEEFLRSIYIHEYYHVGQIIYNRWMLGHNPYDKKS